jgi:hypothetical protein
MPNTERVTGPGKGMISLIVVLVLCVLSAGLIWTLHKDRYVDPLDPIAKNAAPAPTAAH